MTEADSKLNLSRQKRLLSTEKVFFKNIFYFLFIYLFWLLKFFFIYFYFYGKSLTIDLIWNLLQIRQAWIEINKIQSGGQSQRPLMGSYTG